jgi:hypothetical protein
MARRLKDALSGRLVEDLRFEEGPRILHVLNTPRLPASAEKVLTRLL